MSNDSDTSDIPWGKVMVISIVLDIFGFVMGWVYGPEFGLEPLIGAAVGLLLASIPMTSYIMIQVAKHSEEEAE